MKNTTITQNITFGSLSEREREREREREEKNIEKSQSKKVGL